MWVRFGIFNLLRLLRPSRTTRPVRTLLLSHHLSHPPQHLAHLPSASLLAPHNERSTRVSTMAAENGIITPKRKDGSTLSPTSLKKRRVLEERSQVVNTPAPTTRGLKSSQPVKSSFEEDLDRLTQEIGEVGDSKRPDPSILPSPPSCSVD